MKREFHYFTLTDYEKEEQYLRRMHNQGWKLVQVRLPGFYYFEKCTPADVVYRLDFNPDSNAGKGEYIQLFADYGWEYMQDLNNYSYFRKPYQEGEMNSEIFSDDESRLEMLKKIFRFRMLPILAVFLLCLLPNFLNLFNLAGFRDPWDIALWVLYIVLFACYICLFVHMGVGFRRLKRKYARESE